MVRLVGTLSHFQPTSALVVGDFMLDTYTAGRVKRISPEAPVPVMEVLRQDSRPGGAGNVALNLSALGADVFAVGRIGSDEGGDLLRRCLEQEGVDAKGLFIEERYRTPVKNRLIADSQQLLRVDLETIAAIGSDFEELVVDHLATLVPQVKVVALSDYGKGFLTPGLIRRIIAMARAAGVPLIVDPKGIDFTKYRGATVLKPNMSEAYAAAKVAQSETLETVAEKLLLFCEVEQLLITRSEAGISVFDRDRKRSDFPVVSREVKDVTGAGDTVLAMVSLALANGLDIASAAGLANIAAGIAIERLGCAQVTLAEVARRLLEMDFETKVFDDSHTFALRQVLKDRSYSVLVLGKGQKMSNALFRTLRMLGRQEGEELVVYVRDTHPEDEFIHLLSSLQEIDYIILHTESLKVLSEAIEPKRIHYLEDERLSSFDSPQEMLATLRAHRAQIVQ